MKPLAAAFCLALVSLPLGVGAQQQAPTGPSPLIAPAQQGPEQPYQPTVQLPADLTRVLTDYEAAWQAKDANALALLFAEDGFVLASGRQPIRGRTAIEEAYRGRGGALTLRAIAYAADGSVGWIIGAFSRYEGETDIGKFTLTLRKGKDGRWLIASDMDSPNFRNR